MKILHTISSIGVKGGGTSSCLYALINSIKGYDFDILSYELDEDDKLPGNFSENIHLDFVKKAGNGFNYSSDYKKQITNNSSKLFHTHGVWEYTELITAKVARKRNIPYVITPHGMLYPQALKHSTLKKTLFLKLFLLKDLNHASAIHVTCEEEMRHIRHLGVTAPIAIIPNAVEVTEINKTKIISEKIKLGYLGRVHPRKNIEKLLYALESLKENRDKIELIIIGDGDPEYMNFLQNEKLRLDMGNVTFTGFLSGNAKEEYLNSLNFLIVPSDFENFGMIIAEALVRKIPVIASKGTPWEDLENYSCGWWVNNDVETLANTIKEAISVSEESRMEMGERGRKLILEKYSTEIVSAKMAQFYTWVLNGGDKPDFVYIVNNNNT